MAGEHDGGPRAEQGAAAVATWAQDAVAAHVTDAEGPVYGIVGLPEEVVAVILAYVSRSPKSFRDNLAELMAQDVLDLGAGAAGAPSPPWRHAAERARAFHERWVVNYGHASVAEHATVHLGVEGISRLASAALETANPFLSFTEYSQRYQRPSRGGYVTPPEAEALPADLRQEYEAVQERLFDAYERLLEGVAAHLLDVGAVRPRPGEEAPATLRRARRRAFEDARYALSLATRTSLGMTANGRALRDAIALMGESPWGEVRDLAMRLREQGERLLPTLLRHAEPFLPPAATAPVGPGGAGAASEGAGTDADVRLLSAWPEEDGEAIRALARTLGLTAAGGAEDPVAFLRERRAKAGPHAPAHAAMRAVRYRFALRISEANWHQLLRHSRGMTLFPAPPGVGDGVTVPPAVARAGLAAVLEASCADAARVHGQMVAAGAPAVAAYVVTNAHRRQVVADLDLWELDHLVRLRLRDNAQWDIRRTVRAMVAAAAERHPFLRALYGEEVGRPLPDEAV
ncbi:MAG: FAD-dependent thymidylate synthase [Firmicutes bacterium]|nr:FAD-dependent thymidylate synthase [Bacillota bacterium]